MDYQKLKEIGLRIRQELPKTCPDLLPYPQPGLFKGEDVLLIFQNPGLPREQKIADKILMSSNSSIDEVEEAYEETLKTSYLGRFIEDIGLSWDNISVTNIVKAPTENNRAPTRWEINLNMNYLKEQLECINPKLIILVGSIARHRLKYFTNGTKVLCIHHYSYAMRKGIYKQFVVGVKDEIQKYC